MRIAPDPLAPVAVATGHLSMRRRIGLWLLAWGVAALATVVPALGLLLFCWLFPLGLLAPFGLGAPSGASSSDSPWAANAVLLGGWVIYAALSFYGLRQRERARYFRAYALLIALLLLNVAGCRYEVAHVHFGC